MDEKTLSDIRNFVLQNAVRYNGKADPQAISGKILGENPSLRKDPKSAMLSIRKVVDAVNALSLDQQKEELMKAAPKMLEKKVVKRRDIFDVLGIEPGDEVVTAFPPGPEKYPHIGHAKACLFNYLIAKKHNGKFYLRFEDTNPNLVKEEFYRIMQEDFRWLGIEWDKLIYASDHMDLFYGMAEKVLREGHAYVCSCSPEKVKESRMKSMPCKCRDRLPEKNLDLWGGLFSKQEGKGIVRLKIDLSHKNSTMRDPTIFRIITTPHARQGDKYPLWPNYDFQNAIMDGHYRITHRVRSKEFEMRSELQRHIQDLLGFGLTRTFEFARFNIIGVESSGRVIREKVESGELIGWDDPLLTTLVALRRRGFCPDAIKEFLLKTGMTKSEATLTWDDLIMHNKRVLDSADRMFFVEQPGMIHIRGTPNKVIAIRRHPEIEDRGSRYMDITGDFYLSADDLGKIQDGQLYRLMDCLNFRRVSGEYVYDSDDLDKYRKEGQGIFHFLPASIGIDEVQVMMPDKSIRFGKCEKIDDLAPGDIVQFERFGFVRLDDKAMKRFWFTHN